MACLSVLVSDLGPCGSRSVLRERMDGSACREGVAFGKVSCDGCSWKVLKMAS